MTSACWEAWLTPQEALIFRDDDVESHWSKRTAAQLEPAKHHDIVVRTRPPMNSFCPWVTCQQQTPEAGPHIAHHQLQVRDGFRQRGDVDAHALEAQRLQGGQRPATAECICSV